MSRRAVNTILRSMHAGLREYERQHMTPEEIDRRTVKAILAKLEIGETISRDDFVRENIPSDAITYRFRANLVKALVVLAAARNAS